MTVDDLYNLIVQLRSEGRGGCRVYLSTDEEGNGFNEWSGEWELGYKSPDQYEGICFEDPDEEDVVVSEDAEEVIVLWP